LKMDLLVPKCNSIKYFKGSCQENGREGIMNQQTIILK
jgi:hypothetical protein